MTRGLRWLVGISCIVAVLQSPSLVAQRANDSRVATAAVYIRAPRTNADPRARLVEDLRTYFRDHPRERVRVVDEAKDAQFVVDVKRPDITGSVSPYIESGAGDDRITATAVYVAAAHVCTFENRGCVDFTASAKLRTMATLQLAEKISKHVARTSR